MHTTVSSKGQIVIPARLRREFGLQPGKRLTITKKGKSLVLSGEESDFDAWLESRKTRPPLAEPLVVERSAEMPPAPNLGS